LISAIELRVLFDDRLVPDLKLPPYADLATRNVMPCALVALASVVGATVWNGLFNRATNVAQVVRQMLRVQSRLHGKHPAIVDEYTRFKREVVILRYS